MKVRFRVKEGTDLCARVMVSTALAVEEGPTIRGSVVKRSLQQRFDVLPALGGHVTRAANAR